MLSRESLLLKICLLLILGIATVVYNNPSSAGHAKMKIDGFDIFGSPIAVRFARGAGAMQGWEIYRFYCVK